MKSDQEKAKPQGRKRTQWSTSELTIVVELTQVIEVRRVNSSGDDALCTSISAILP
jgi:hypothetical protein